MDQRELVRQLEAHFRKEDEKVHEHRRRVHEERGTVSDDEWWADLIEKTQAIRPQMLEVFERNKQEMIAKRFQTISSEEGFREKTIQRKVMELLPFISSLRADRGETGDLTAEQIQTASSKKSAQELEIGLSKLEAGKDKVTNPTKRELLDLVIEDGRAFQQESAFLRESGEIDEAKFEEFSKNLMERQKILMEKTEEIRLRRLEENN